MKKGHSRKALIIGINSYAFAPLHGCVDDAREMECVLAADYNGDPNFDCQLLTCEKRESVTTRNLKTKISQLFEGDPDFALFYFSGHGYLDDVGGYIVPVDTQQGDELSMDWIVSLASQSKAKEILFILDCCHAGALSNSPSGRGGHAFVQMRKGMTILAGTTHDDVAREWKGRGIFNRILVDGLNGAAADLLGNVTAASLYNHADSLLNSWEQRPVFKSFVHQMTPIRLCKPRVPKDVLRSLVQLFPEPAADFPLDPAYEETSPSPDAKKVEDFRKLRAMERVGIVECCTQTAMFWEAMGNGACRLTSFGRFIHEMVKRNRL